MMDDASEAFLSVLSQDLATTSATNFLQDNHEMGTLQANGDTDTFNWWLFTTMSSILWEVDPLEQFSETSSFYNSTNSSINNSTDFSTSSEMPQEMSEMSQTARTSVLIYSIIWIVASTGNLTVFASCYRQYKKHKSRITLLILHLSVADLIVTFCLIPIEIIWRITIQWYGGNVLCKLCQFMRAFGLYLSSMVLICVSFDRFFSILFPLKFAGGKHRVKVMLALAWVASGIFSFPQAILFSVESHPKFTTFRQCVTSSFLSTPEDVRMYSIFSVSAMYFAPLLVIIFTYTAILLKIIRKSRQQQSTLSHSTTSATEMPSRNNSSIRNRLRRTKSTSASTTRSTTVTPSMNNDIGNPNTPTGTFTPSPSSKPSATRFNFSRQSIERTKNRGISVRWGRGTTLQVPGVDVCRNSPSGSGINCETAFSGNDGSKCHFHHQLQEQMSSKESSEEQLGCSPVVSNLNPVTSTINCNTPPSVTSSEPPLSRAMSMRSNGKTQLVLRMSTNATSNITRAKSRTLRLTIVIVIVFVFCWTPYTVITLWYMFDFASARTLDPLIQDALFMMAVANSCVNPLVYGSFTKNCCGLTKRLGNRSRKDGRPSTIKEALESNASNN